eukprot:Pompholyxophrys_punicea_v1_NODE_477_length_1875_cov_7.916484.p1 type:complete len:333 gc:universal NODE_477_length_1875_cov_7.916484:790-1788(+)
MITAYKAAVKNGFQAGQSGLKKKGWNFIESRMKLAGHDINCEQLKNCWQKQKRLYKIYHALINNSGFGIDPETKAPTAADHIWEYYLKAHPKAAIFKNKAWPLYDDFYGLFGEKVATGASRTAVHDLVTSATITSDSDDSEESDDSNESDSEDEVTPKKPPVSPIEPVILETPKRKAAASASATEEPQAKKKATSADKLSEAISKLRSVPPLQQAMEILWKTATVPEAMEIQKLLAKDATLATIFLGMPAEQRHKWIQENCRQLEPVRVAVPTAIAQPTMEAAFNILFTLSDVAEEKKMKIVDLLSTNEQELKVFMSLPPIARIGWINYKAK